MNKQDLIQKIKQLEGLSLDEKAVLINLVNTKKKYGLIWEEKLEEVEEQLREKLPVLSEVKSKEIVNGDQSPNHILIEGDNLHSLTALTFTHEDAIDMIYIDPPYNTGSNDFKYNDNYVDKEDEFRHSKWLSFINKRLKIAKTLLKREGVIFISINEDELCQLKILCDEIFGIDNYLTVFTIKVRHENRILKGDKDFHEVTEFLLLYRKSADFKTVKRIEDNTSNDLYVYKIEELVKEPTSIILDNKQVSVFHPGEYRIIKTEPDVNSLKKISIRGSIKEGNSSGRFFMKHFAKKIGVEFSTLYRVPNMGDDEMPYRYFLLPENTKRVNGDYFQGVPQNRTDNKDVPYPNYFDFVDEFNNVGYEGGIEFRNGKKPILFLHKIFEIAGFKKGLILDFFAGSGSTLHAVMQLNADDGGDRKCILITNNENNICEEVTYARNKKVIKGYKNERGGDFLGLVNNNLRYYKSAFVNREPSLKNKIELTKLATELLCIKEDCYKDITSTFIDQKNSWLKIFHNANEQYLFVLYDDNHIEEGVKYLQELIKNKRPQKSIKVYVFSNGQYPYTEEFEDVLEYIKLCALPDAIYKAYLNVLPKRKRVEIPEIEESTTEEVERALEEEENNSFNQEQ